MPNRAKRNGRRAGDRRLGSWPPLGRRGAARRGAVILDGLRLGSAWTVAAVLAGALVWSYWPVLRDLVEFWQLNPDYSAGALVPLVAAYATWQQRRALGRLEARVCWWGLAGLLAAQAVRFVGVLYAYGSLERYSIVLTLAAGCLLLLGPRVSLRLAWILGFLLLMVPLPVRVHNAVAIPLQEFASRSAVVGLEMLGQLVAREGNVLRLSDQTTVAVAEACSGLRMLMAFLIVAAALALVVRRSGWYKAVVVASSIPVATLANTLRLIVTVLLFEHVGSQAGERFFHDFAGLAMMPFAWAVLMGELWLMGWIGGESRGAGGPVAVRAGGSRAHRPAAGRA